MSAPQQLSLPMPHPGLPRARAYLVVDLETTCSRDGAIPWDEMETIEIGAVLMDGQSLSEIGRFQSFVRPARAPTLTPFCTQLTSITQRQVDGAPSFPEAMAALRGALLEDPAGMRFCSWTPFDHQVLARDCAQHGIPYPLPPHLDLKAAFAGIMDTGKSYGLRYAMDICGLPFEGTHHRGIDDAFNTARLLPFLKDPALGKAALKAYQAKPRAERREDHARRRRERQRATS